MKLPSHIVSRSSRFSMRGLTLIELLVVLIILVGVSTVALSSLTQDIEQSRYDANILQIEEIEKAIIGTGQGGGFLRDIGRLPNASGTDPFLQLEELWDQGTLATYAINTPAGDTDIRMGTGWRGPYLDLGMMRDELRDGFGNAFDFLQTDGTASDDGDPIHIIRSRGLDDALGGTSFNEDASLILQQDSPVENNWQANLVIRVVGDGADIQLANGTGLYLRIYGPDGAGSLHTIQQENIVLTADTPHHDFNLTDIFFGEKILRAYQTSTAPADKDTLFVGTTFASPATSIKVGKNNDSVTLTLYPVP